MHPNLKIHITQNQHKKLKPGLVTSYNMWSENGVGLFWQNRKGWKSKKIDKASKKEKRGKVKDTKR